MSSCKKKTASLEHLVTIPATMGATAASVCATPAAAPPDPADLPTNPQTMRTLIPGLALDLAHTPARRRDAVRLSAGTQHTDDAGLIGYAERSYVPRLPWRSPTDEEWRALTQPQEEQPGDEIKPPGDRISVFRVPESVLEPFAYLRELSYETGNLRRIQALIEDVAGRNALVEAARYARSLAYCGHTGLDAPIAHAKIPPGTPTMTTGRDGRLTGLHVDSWYRSELEGRASSPNRLSINLGVHDRYLLFVNLPLRSVAAHVARAHGETKLADSSFALPREFARLFPGYPVVKLRIAPGEAYIAPTENVIHDGYAERTGGIDLRFTCRGYFRASDPWAGTSSTARMRSARCGAAGARMSSSAPVRPAISES